MKKICVIRLIEKAKRLKKKIYRQLKIYTQNHRKLYVCLKALKSWHTDDFCKLVYSYYEETNEYASFLVEHKGKMHPNDVVYYFYSSEKTEKSEKDTTGFFARFRWVLQMLNVADYLGMKPVVQIGSNFLYYDPEMDDVTQNVFEYYFQPVSDISCTDVNSCANVIRFRTGQAQFFMKHASSWAASYEIEEDEVERLGEIYKKYIRLNRETDEYIREAISKCLQGKRTLGLHIRGADYNVGFASHPNVISVQEYLAIAGKMFASGKYDRIFLATDDLHVLEAFQNQFGDKLAYYDDVLRSGNTIGVHAYHNARERHHYKLGLEVIRDVYTLASCDSLICGLSQVAFAARYVRRSKDKTYDELRIVNHGIKND